MYRTVATLILAAMYNGLHAQIVIDGTVLDAQGKVVDAYITATSKDMGNILGFADTDSKGHYKLEIKSTADSLIVTAAGLTIGNQVKIIANRSQRLDFRVKEQTVQLKEVSVRAQKIRQHGDTLSYLVGAYQQQGDRVIGDVLKRMPGIEVADNGGIKYNGKAIKKFYVEEMDLLQGRYGLATNNINASDVATVQVLENHQPVKMLQGKELSDDVAINLKLKDSAKGTVAINTMLGGGIQQTSSWHIGSRSLDDGQSTIGQNPLWTAEVVGMYFAKRRQNMTLYKGNNTGDDVSKELTQHYSSINSISLYPFCPTGTVMPSGSGLPQKRTFDNHSHILTMNHMEKPNKDTELNLNIAYYNDRIRREGSSVGDRFICNDSRLLTSETMTSETKVNNLSIQGRYAWNATNGFVANVLKFDTNWNSDRVDGLLSSERTGIAPVNYGNDRVRQHFDRPQLSISNTFNTIRNIGNNTFDLHFSAGYSHHPNTLIVGIDSLLRGTQAAYSQDVNSHHIAGRFNTSYGIRVADHFKFNYGISASANLHGIITNLGGFTPPAGNNQLNNDLWYNTYSLAFYQSYKYETRNLDLTLGLPLTLYAQTLDDRIRDDKHGYTHLLFFPSLSLNWIITRDLWLNGGVNYSKTVGDPGGIYSGYIMSNYRAFQRSYVEQFSETKNYGANVGLRYRSAIRALFANLGFNYHRTHDNQIYGYSYEGATSVVQAVNQPTVASSYSINGEASKGFNFLRSTIRVFGSYSLSESERLISQNLYQYHAQGLGFGGSLSFSPFEWVGIVYSCGFSQSRSYTEGHRDQSTTVRSNTQRLSMSVYPTKTLTLSLAAEDNYNNLTAENRHAWFSDTSVKLKHIDLELQLNNLFDQRLYTHVSYSGLDIYTQTSQLRPRNAILTVRFKLL
ncbi:MAG: outer membrane beta-barrel protein [Bacteroidaceae bacterium]|nr:outer membrane beta-barrel protein [Bacteroidaceae bacterium]